MQIRRLGVLGTLSLLVLPAMAADGVAGKWNGSVEVPGGGPIQLVFDFAVEGEKLTGTISMGDAAAGGMPPFPISEGAVKGNDVTFKLVMQIPGGDAAGGPPGLTIDYKGTLKGDELALVSTIQGAPEGVPPETPLTLKRAK